MSFRIRSVGIYSRRDGALKSVLFNREGLSIVTGRSSRGKSALLDIVDYCLLSKHCGIAKGVIRDAVSHVGAVFESPTGECMLIVRPLPQEGRLTSSEVQVVRGDHDLPSAPPATRWNLDTAREALSEFAGIEALPVLTNDHDSDVEKRHPANIRHCAPYLFQPQDVLASRSVLFPGVEDNFVRRHVSDAAYYFLGIVSVDLLAKRRELQRLIASRNEAKRQRLEQERRSSRGWERGLRLWSDASAAGLVSGDTPTTMETLFRALDLANRNKINTVEQAVQTPQIDQVQRKEAELRRLLRERTLELAEADRLASTGSDHAVAADGQIGRLRIRELLPASAEHRCPLCGVGEVNVEDIEEQIATGLVSLQSGKTAPKRLSARLEHRREELRRELADIADKLKPLQVQLRELFKQLQLEQTAFEEARRREQLIGRISEYLSSVGVVARAPDDLSRIEARISELERQVGEAALRAARQATLAELSDQVTRLSRELEVEFPENQVRIDFDSFVLEVRFDSTWVGLNELGSGANWLGYHLGAVVGLHHFLREHSAPVPQFVMLDQPSQVWFPAEVAKVTRRSAPVQDADLAAVRRVYDFLMRHSKGPNAPQIIVSDHARLEDPAFKAATVADWHDDEGLVPSAWL
jgi:hypothetical protein